MPLVSVPNTFTAHTKAKAAEVNANFAAAIAPFNSWPTGQHVGLRALVPWEFDHRGELWISSGLFPVFSYDADQFWELPTIFDYVYIHQNNTTTGTTTILLKRKRSGVDTTLATITVAASTAAYTQQTGTFSDTPADGDAYWVDVTAVGHTPPANVTIYMMLSCGTGS